MKGKVFHFDNNIDSNVYDANNFLSTMSDVSDDSKMTRNI